MANLVALGCSPEWVLAQTPTEQLSWFIAIGTAKGGEWDFDKMDWSTPIPPQIVYAVPAQLKS